MDFKFYFSEQLKMHPSMQYQDVIKLCYQASFGAEHLLTDLARARAYLKSEFDSVLPTNEPLFEQISPEIVRVNLGAWKRDERSLEALFEAFKNSAILCNNARDTFLSYLEIAKQSMSEQDPDFDNQGWQNFIEEYKACGMPSIHHSEEYRKSERPSYRIVKMTELENIL